jgi:hypothetical protein
VIVMEFLVLLVGRSAVADQLVGARAGDPVLAPAERRGFAGPTRRRLAVALHTTADRVAPREPAPAGC